LSTNIKLSFYKALNISVVTHASPTWEYAADAHLLKLQRLQNRGFRSNGKFDGCTTVHEFHVTFKIPYVYDYITKLCRTWVEVILNYVNPNAHDIGQGEGRHRKNKRLKLGGGQAYDCSAD
jgi:hypothetical protein